MNIIRVLIKQVIHDKRYIFYAVYCFIYVFIAKKLFDRTEITDIKFIINMYFITVMGITNLVCLDLLEIENRLKIRDILFKVANKSKSYLHIRNIAYCLIYNLLVTVIFLIISFVLFQTIIFSLLIILIGVVLTISIYILDAYSEHLTILTTFTRSLIRNFIILVILYAVIQIT